MAIQTISVLKNWFKTGLKPTQNQFHDWLDSFRHKSAKVPVDDVDGLSELLSGAATTEQINNITARLDAIFPDEYSIIIKRSDDHRIRFIVGEDDTLIQPGQDLGI